MQRRALLALLATLAATGGTARASSRTVVMRDRLQLACLDGGAGRPVVLVTPTTPLALKTVDNPEGIDRALYDKTVAARPDLRAFALPTLVICGSVDEPNMVPNAARTAAAIAASRLATYEGAPHGLFLTDPERFNRDLLEFARS